MLDVDGRIHIDPHPQKLFYILIPFFVPAPLRIGMCQFINQDQLWFPLQCCIQIKLPQSDAFIFKHQRGQHFQSFRQCLGIRAGMRFNITGNHINPVFLCLMCRFQHRIRLSGTCGIPQENLQFSPVFFSAVPVPHIRRRFKSSRNLVFALPSCPSLLFFL